MNKKIYIIIKKETVLQSITKDVFSMIVVILFVTISRFSTTWTVLSSITFIIIVIGVVSKYTSKLTQIFVNKYDAIDYLKDLK